MVTSRARGENLDVAFGVFVGYVEPELVELVGAGAVAVEPDVAFLGLAELAAVALGDEGAGECEAFLAGHAANEFRACGDVAPLVGAAELQTAVLVFREPVEVVGLEQLVGEFGER